MLEALSVGISKLIGQVWFGGSPAIKLLYDESVSAVSSSISDKLERRKAERFFEDCADVVLGRAADFLKIEFAKIENYRAEALVEDIASCFGKFSLDKEFIASNFSDALLTKRIMNELIVIDRKSADEAQFCNSVVGHISFYICEYVHLAPDFLPKTVAQILENQYEIQSILQTILENSSLHRDDADILEVESASYVSRMKKYVSFIQVFGLSTHSIKKKYKLEASYISLTATEEQNDGSQSTNIPIGESLYGEGPYLIVGAAGSGKSTLLQWIALSCCDPHLRGRISRFDGLIPVFIRLRSMPSLKKRRISILEAAKLSNPDLFVGVDERWFVDRTENGGAVILLDGLDEVPTEERGRVNSWIADISTRAPDCPVIVTTRPTNEELPFQGPIQSSFLENMSVIDVDKFVTYWHRAVGSGMIDEALLNSLDQSRERLLSALRALSELRTLATNPLMCAILCTINLDRNCNIPREKSEIYAVVIDLLLNRRDKERDIEGFAISDIPPKTRRAILQECARWLTLNENTELSRTKFVEIVGTELDDLKASSVEEVAESFVDRSGLLREISAESVEFIHKQFQEHLAAESFVQEDDIGLLEGMIGKDAWKEIFPAASALMNKSQATRFIMAMIAHFRGASSGIERNGFFQVVVCAEFARKLEETVAQDVQDIQIQIFPPQTVEEVYQLLPLGERLKQLVASSNTANFSDSSVALCLKALIETGGSDVISVISALKDLGGPESVRQLIRGWTYFDPVTYGREIVSSIKIPYDLEWKGVVNSKGLPHALNARRIHLFECMLPDSLSDLPENKLCETLKISEADFLRTTGGIEKLPSLKVVSITNCRELRSLEGIPSLRSLRKLELSLCLSLSDLDCLDGMNSIEELTLSGCYDILNIRAIGKMGSLQRLEIDGCFGITDWRPLLRAPNLVEVRCSETGWIDQMDEEFIDRVAVY